MDLNKKKLLTAIAIVLIASGLGLAIASIIATNGLGVYLGCVSSVLLYKVMTKYFVE